MREVEFQNVILNRFDNNLQRQFKLQPLNFNPLLLLNWIDSLCMAEKKKENQTAIDNWQLFVI